MNRTFHAFHLGDCYEVVVRDFNLVRVVKHSDTGLRREIDFDALAKPAQEAIIEKFSEVLMDIET